MRFTVRAVRHATRHAREHNKRHEKLAELRKEFTELQEERRTLLRKYHRAERAEKKALGAQLDALEQRMQACRLKMHLMSGHRSDLNDYYRHIRVTRPVVLAFELLLWGALFFFAGVPTGLKVVILVFTIATTAGSVFELSFLLRTRDRILRPVEELKAGVEEVARGNYDVEVKVNEPNEVGPLVDAFNAMARRLGADERLKAEYEENRKELVANISHDLKTPITSIEGYIEALLEREDLPPEKKRRYLTIIGNNATYLNRLIDDLFLFSKLDMQKLEMHFERTNLRRFMHDMMEEFSLDFGERGIDFRYSDELERDCEAMIDAKRFHQVIRNILGNAVKYGPQEGLRIEVRLYRGGGEFCIDLKDNGPGIEPEKLFHIFERFYRVDSERTKDFAGTGLGLAIAKELMQSHGGRITVKSELTVGTCFTISQPILKSEGERS